MSKTAAAAVNPYTRMFVLPENEYKEFKRYKAAMISKSREEEEVADPSVASTSSSLVKCPICDRGFLNANILAHHQKSHFTGHKCNICGKIFKSSQSLHGHLKRHPPQVKPSNESVLNISSTKAVPKKKKKQQQHKQTLKFTAKQWLTL
jgi:hypothetical protein